MRKEAQKQRNLLTKAEISLKSAHIADFLIGLDEFRKAKLVMCYLSFGSEVSTWDFAKICLDSGKRLAVPKVVRQPNNIKEMIACEITDLKEGLIPGPFGIMEPAEGRFEPVAFPQIDLVIVPGLIFTKSRYRLGYGGGYYDRFLQNKSDSCTSAGVCFELQLAPNLPIENHDIPVDMVVTEHRIIDKDSR